MAENIAQWGGGRGGGCLYSMQDTLGSFPGFSKNGHGGAYLKFQWLGNGGRGIKIQCHPWLFGKFEESPDCLRPCLKAKSEWGRVGSHLARPLPWVLCSRKETSTGGETAT